MDRKIEKFLFLLKPIGLSTAGLVVIYCLFDVIFIVKLKIFGMGYNDYLIFFILMVAFIGLFMAPIIMLIECSQFQKGLVIAISICSVMASSAIGKVYIEKAFGEMTTVSTPAEILDSPQTEYYKIKDWKVTKEEYEENDVIEKGTGSNSLFTYYINSYFVSPFIPYTDSNSTVWMCKEYSTIVTSYNSKDVEDKLEPLSEQHRKEYFSDLLNDRIFDKVKYFERIYSKDDRYEWYSNVLRSKNVNGDLVLLYPKYDENANGVNPVWSAVKWLVISNIVIITVFMCVPFNKRKYIEMKRENRGVLRRGIDFIKSYLKSYKDDLHKLLSGSGRNPYERKQ